MCVSFEQMNEEPIAIIKWEGNCEKALNIQKNSESCFRSVQRKRIELKRIKKN